MTVLTLTALLPQIRPGVARRTILVPFDHEKLAVNGRTVDQVDRFDFEARQGMDISHRSLLR